MVGAVDKLMIIILAKGAPAGMTQYPLGAQISTAGDDAGGW